MSTSPIEGQKMGTSGLRKPTKTFMQASLECLDFRVAPASPAGGGLCAVIRLRRRGMAPRGRSDGCREWASIEAGMRADGGSLAI